MAWSIFTQGGGNGAALSWAVDLLHKLGAPTSAGNQQVIYDWEVSEGGGGTYNPLNQGVDPANTSLTSGGNSSGGGAANYVSWAAGLQGAADYLSMPNFSKIGDDLRANNPAAARNDIITSPWAASHYGNGRAFSNAGIPGAQTPLPAAGGSPNAPVPVGTSTSSDPGITGALTDLTSNLKTFAIVVPVVIGGAALVVWGAGRMTGTKPAADAAKIGALLLWTSTTTSATAAAWPSADAPSSPA